MTHYFFLSAHHLLLVIWTLLFLSLLFFLSTHLSHLCVSTSVIAVVVAMEGPFSCTCAKKVKVATFLFWLIFLLAPSLLESLMFLDATSALLEFDWLWLCVIACWLSWVAQRLRSGALQFPPPKRTWLDFWRCPLLIMSSLLLTSFLLMASYMIIVVKSHFLPFL